MENQNPNITKEMIGELSQREMELVYHIRNRFRYGKIEIETRDGQPFRISKMVEYQTLG